LLPEGERYAAAVTQAAEINGTRLIAHAYVRTLGDLSTRGVKRLPRPAEGGLSQLSRRLVVVAQPGAQARARSIGRLPRWCSATRCRGRCRKRF
jgi:hypothetical protein